MVYGRELERCKRIADRLLGGSEGKQNFVWTPTMSGASGLLGKRKYTKPLQKSNAKRRQRKRSCDRNTDLSGMQDSVKVSKCSMKHLLVLIFASKNVYCYNIYVKKIA